MIGKLSPSSLCYKGTFLETANLLSSLDCRRAHLDFTAGYGIYGMTRLEEFEAEDRRHFRMPVDLHLFDFRRRWTYDDLPLIDGDCLVLHRFPWLSRFKVQRALEVDLPNGVQRGLSVDLETDLDQVIPLLPKLDVLMIMGIEIGGRGVPLNPKALQDLEQARRLIRILGKPIRLVIDGGVNVKTFPVLAKLVDTMVIGGLLFNSPDLLAQWNELQRWLKEIENDQSCT